MKQIFPKNLWSRMKMDLITSAICVKERKKEIQWLFVIDASFMLAIRSVTQG